MPNLSRRKFLKLGGLSAAFLALTACKPDLAVQHPTLAPTPTVSFPTATGTIPPMATPQINVKDEAAIAMLLQRITFGARPQEISYALQLGYDQTIDEQINYQSISDPDIDSRLTGLSTLSMSPSDLLNVSPKTKPVTELTQAALLRAIYSKRQLYELMVDFWSNHFNIFAGKSTDAYLKPQDDQAVIRKYALGNFFDLLSASAHSPAMLVYLDNAVSTKNQPNENYARELLELHTLGVDGGYTQQDVSEVARALTGWGTGGQGKNFGKFVYTATNHDDGLKTILGSNFLSGQGIADGEKVIDLLAHHPQTAKFIATKLVRRFVADEPPQDLVNRAAAAFTQSKGEISQVMSVILRSVELRSSFGQKLKRPFEWLVSAMRAVDANAKPDTTTIAALGLLGQPPFHWVTPDGFPDKASAWTSTTGLLNRWNLSLAIAFNTLTDCQVNVAGLVSAQASPEAIIDQLSRRILGQPLAPDAAQVVTGYYKSANALAAAPGVVALLLASPFFQYR
jgi:uncharacterized protein (DUF1800 family)